jgi:transposase-like protein
MTFYEFQAKFPTEKAAIDYFLETRYHGELVCPHCGAKIKVYKDRKRARVCHCRNCGNSFSPFSGTIFEKSSTDFRKWFYAIHLVLNAKKGISGCQLQRELGVTYKTAWRMLRLIREAMGNGDMKDFSVFVEVDETYIGGKPRKENGKPKAKRGRGTSKTPVVGVIERGTGKVRAKVMLPDAAGKKLSGKQLLEVVKGACAEGTTVATDDFRSYGILDRKGSLFYHVTVNHSLGQFSAGNGIHTNTIESFWSLLKKQYFGTHHHYSVKYMQGYLDEMCFR